MKKILSIILSVMFVFSFTVTANAENYTAIPDDSALTFYESRQKGIPYDKPLHQKSKEELIQEGILFYGGTVQLNPGSDMMRATTSSVLGYITAPGKTYVYSGKGTGTQLGYVTFREIVFISSISGNYAYIQFKNASGNLTYGYIDNNAVYSPAYGWATPIVSGRIIQYFNETATDDEGHTGIDVGGHNGNHPAVYATYSGTASFRETIRTYPNGTKIFADYGNHVRLSSGSYEVIYAHLDSFGQNVSSHSYDSEGYPVSSTIANLPKNTFEITSKNVSKSVVLGYVGTTGKSTGIHLHFEVRVNGVQKDPFTYVVFPNVSWAQ